MGTIAVIGATGNIGSRVVGALQGRGAQVRAVARNPQAAEGVEAHAADLTDQQAAIDALEGVEAVYLTPPEGGATPTATESLVGGNVIDAAAKQGVAHVVMHTAVHADRGDTGARILDNKTGLEHALAASGVGYTILRPAWFLQNLWAARDYLEQGVVSLPWPGDMTWAATDINDIATAAVRFLEQGPANRGFDVHIPGGITGNDLAAAATEVLGREVAYHEADATARQYVDAFPISEPHKDLYAELFDHFTAAPYLGDPDPITEALTGFTYRGPADFLREELFAGS